MTTWENTLQMGGQTDLVSWIQVAQDRNQWRAVLKTSINFYRCTVHSDVHTIYLPTDAHLLKL
jgi:hypothetical protein